MQSTQLFWKICVKAPTGLSLHHTGAANWRINIAGRPPTNEKSNAFFREYKSGTHFTYLEVLSRACQTCCHGTRDECMQNRSSMRSSCSYGTYHTKYRACLFPPIRTVQYSSMGGLHSFSMFSETMTGNSHTSFRIILSR